ncbi:condensation domain-containing protein, partial [Paenibacillus sp. YSY-4.3]
MTKKTGEVNCLKYSPTVLDSIDEFKQAKEYWLTKLPYDAKCTTYPADYQSKAKGSKTDYEFSLDSFISDELIKISKNGDTLLYVYLLTTLKVVLYKTLYEESIVIGAPIYSSYSSDTEYNDYILLSDRINGGMTFKDSLLIVNHTFGEATKHQYYPIKNLMKLLNIPPDYAYKTIILLENIHSATMIEDKIRSASNDITVMFKRTDNQITGTVKYKAQAFNAITIKLLVDRFKKTLQQVIAEPNTFIKDITLDAEQRFAEYNNTAADYPREAVLHKLVEASASANPAAE